VTIHGDEVRALIAAQAAEWYVANQAGPLPPSEQASFLTWLRTSPTHLSEYLGLARVARELTGVIGEPREPLEAYVSGLPLHVAEPALIEPRVVHHEAAPRRGRARWRRPVAALAAGLLIATMALVWRTRAPELASRAESYRTAHDDGAVARLQDGSVVQLDVDTEVTVRYEARERVVELGRGRAFFRVAHQDGQRRFRVQSGAAGAIAVGTQFDVQRRGDGAVFTVAEGEIAVMAGAWDALRGETGLPSGLRHVTAGYQLIVTDSNVAQPTAVDLSRALAWLHQTTVFDHRSLAEVVAEFNRTASVPIEIENPELRALSISGVFDVGDTESFVAFLRTLSGVTVTATPGRIVVARAGPAPRSTP
jgi:ferric-dicitrate binding protein FerR (iron transport regulator)